MSLLVARRRLLTPHAGVVGPGYSLVGTAGTATTASGGSTVSPAWGSGASRTVDNLLLCLVASGGGDFGGITAPATPGTWTKAVDRLNVTANSCASLFWKLATGGESAPTFSTVAGTYRTAKLYEFAGNPTSSVLNWQQSNVGDTSPFAVTLGGTDTAASELVIVVGACTLTFSQAASLSHSVNNATLTVDHNNGSVTPYHYSFGYGITTTNASADSDTFSSDPFGAGATAVMASYRHA